MMTGQGQLASFKQDIKKPVRLGPEHNPWFWNPMRGSIRSAPEWFNKKLHDISEYLAVTWNPITEHWQVWDRCPRVNHPICVGWKLLFIHRDTDGSYLPLDERLFARLFAASADQHGSAKKYFARVVDEMERDAEKAKKASQADVIDQAMESFDYSQIKNIGKGSKFATYHQ